MQHYDAVLFDADGTLIDTLEMIVHCFEHTLSHFGCGFVSRQSIIETVGIPLRPQLEKHLGPLDDDRYRQVETVHMDYQLAVYRGYLKAFPGTVDAVASLRARGVKCAVVTSRRRPTLERYLDAAGFAGLFHLLVSPEDTLRHKPDPEPVNFALRTLGVPPSRALMVGDACYDIDAGCAAGADTAFVLWSHNDPDTLATRPTWFVSRPEELL